MLAQSNSIIQNIGAAKGHKTQSYISSAKVVLYLRSHIFII